MKKKLYIVKIGGNIIDDERLLQQFLTNFSLLNEQKILIHGGGKLATRMAAQLGIEQTMVDGRRITDAETLKIVTMVYAGYINKQVVALLQSMDCQALVFAEQMPIRYWRINVLARTSIMALWAMWIR